MFFPAGGKYALSWRVNRIMGEESWGIFFSYLMVVACASERTDGFYFTCQLQ